MWLIRNLKTSANYTVSIFIYLFINSDKSSIDEMLIDLCDQSKSGQPRCTQYDLKDYETAQ